MDRACLHLDPADDVVHGGAILDTGDTHLQPLPVAKVYARRNRAGIYRRYLDFATTCGSVHHQRIDTTDVEHLRQHTKTEDGDSVYDHCYGCVTTPNPSTTPSTAPSTADA
ncbi:hypothetical protein [[Mycobacterium] fortunisiensis]|uniref:hypothetical protein n=1 Tax=[Mycobacterium] fortunisiensis TaxID=2600579 RepID=UPI001FE4D821|nr:hypothetical protein [[Mycobacterium] fortunisiensis]